MTVKSIQQAKAAYQGGDWTEAEHLCKIILANKSNDINALNLLGIIAAQTQRPLEAVTLLSQAIAIDPNHAASRGKKPQYRGRDVTYEFLHLGTQQRDFLDTVVIVQLGGYGFGI
jgi:tetratricopeptide (TPR) repeat protein